MRNVVRANGLTVVYGVDVASCLGREGSQERASSQTEKMCERREQIDGSQDDGDDRNKESVRHVRVLLERNRACID